MTDDRIFPVSDHDMAALRRRLTAEAGPLGLLDVVYRALDSPVGPLLIAATDRGLVRLAFASEGFDAVLADLAARIGPRILRAPDRLDEAARQVEGYFQGTRTGFDLPLDHRLSSGFRASVQALLPGIGYGQTRTYKQMAELAGNPRAVRAVGSACATNPIPIVVPCHRVLRSDGGLGGYRGGLAAKRTLLAMEAR